jgi:hypothetical protein
MDLRHMPARAGQFPHHRERITLQKLKAQGELTAAELHPVGSTTLVKMINKGWVERAGSVYRITETGLAAFKAQLPPDYAKKR